MGREAKHKFGTLYKSAFICNGTERNPGHWSLRLTFLDCRNIFSLPHLTNLSLSLFLGIENRALLTIEYELYEYCL
jgi:hypothetical protein